MTEDLRLAYLAGFFDGEGCISASPVMYAGGPNYSIVVNVSQNDGRALEEFARRWGGKISKRERVKGALDDCCLWSIGGKRAIQCIKDLLPYLIGKREEAELAVQWPWAEKIGKGHVTDAAIVARRAEIWAGLKAIKQQKKRAILPDSQPGLERMDAEPKLADREEVKLAVALYLGGMSSQQVADVLSLQVSTVGHWMRQLGHTRPRSETWAMRRNAA